MDFEQTGIPSAQMIEEKFPPLERLERGRCAVVECYRCIPCNPCQTSCPKGAIEIGEDINNIPLLDADKCIGCGLCVYSCPGLAIMLARLQGDEAELSLPYEFLPLPTPNESVVALDREGKPVCKARVTQIWMPPACDRTPIVRIAFEKKYLYEVRNFCLEAER